MTQKITLSSLRHLAKLARIELTSDEEQLYLPQLEAVLEFMEVLNKVDTSAVDPSYQVTGLKNILRRDEVFPSLDQNSALSTASKKTEGYIIVPNTIKK